MEFHTVEYEALLLPPQERAKLAQRLLLSLDELSEEELNELWLSEANRRARELDSGESQPVSSEEVMRKAKALLK